ncbi:MAG: YggS family pyridoxal phosphate-dependent enzyme [Candidatus Omnitrophica bacterium]|nr:YggS family pyridoxal phosphate-dependent enzyme [Candidatus Omnitrophota bacterium]
MIRENIFKARERIPSQVIIVAVAKTRSAEEIKEAVGSGIDNIGENKVQEAIEKYNELKGCGIKWHMVGHLQTNKVKDAVKIFDLIQSVDSLHLALEIDKQAAKINKVQDVLIEVKTSPEATKSGLKTQEAAGIIKEINALKNINIKGLMTIAPAVAVPQDARPYFSSLKKLYDSINASPVIPALPAGRRSPLSILSMGMTDDFEVAIEEGSNMVRLGRAIFEG